MAGFRHGEGKAEPPPEAPEPALPEDGCLVCEQCSSAVNIEGHAPLSLEKCPQCGNLLFIPLELEHWWAMRPLGAGGFGSAYLGYTKASPHSSVVIKVLQRSAHIGPAHETAFRRECELGYSLGRHPHLVEVLAYGDTNGMPFMVMEYVDGIQFQDYARGTRAPLPPEECLYYVLDVVEALDSLLEHGHLHRDVKPDNVIIRPDSRATLIDYGSCMPLEAARIPPVEKTVTGSPHFLSPERYMCAGEDIRSDIYSLGLVLYFGLKGETYSSAETLAQVIRSQVRKLRMPLKMKLSEMDEELVALLERMIAWDREERFGAYAQVREELAYLLCEHQKTEAADEVIVRLRRRFAETYRMAP
jgi:serine/threonine-protein kinase